MVTTDVHGIPAPRLTGRMQLIQGGRSSGTSQRPAPHAPAGRVCAIVGGTGLAAKLDLLARLVTRVDVLALGGGIANSFLAAAGTDMGASLCDHDLIGEARKLLDKARACRCELLL